MQVGIEGRKAISRCVMNAHYAAWNTEDAENNGRNSRQSLTVQGDTARMRTLLIARGAEDARSAIWGHARQVLVGAGHEVLVFDAEQHLIVGKPNTFEYTLNWFLTAQPPQEVHIYPVHSYLVDEADRLGKELGIPTKLIDLPGITAGGEVDADDVRLNLDLFELESQQQLPTIDVLVLADADESRVQYVAALVEKFNVAVYGSGWNRFPDFDAVTHGPPPYIELPALLRKARVSVALERNVTNPEAFWIPVSSAVRALESLAVGTPCVVPASLSGALNGKMPTFTSPETLVHAVTTALNDSEKLREAARGMRAEIERRHSLVVEAATRPVVTVHKDGPKISVFTAVYNAAEFVGETLDSLLGQNEGDLEVLVLDDGSSDDTLGVVSRYESDPRIRVFKQANIGQVGRFDLVWQSLIPHARGSFIASVDGDDISMPDHFERMLQVMNGDRQVGLVHSAGMQINENSEVQGPSLRLAESYDETSQLRSFMNQCLIAHSTILMRREVFDRVGTFEEGFATDYQFWTKMSTHYRLRFLPEALIHYRVHSKGSSRDAWHNQGNRTRHYERMRWTMLDLYPALANSIEARDYAAAHIDLGLRFTRGLVDVDLALQEFGNALALTDGACPEAEWNQALLRWHAGDQTQPTMLRNLMRGHPGLEAGYVNGNAIRFAEGPDMSKVPFAIPAGLESSARAWDGLLATTRRILVLHDKSRPHLTTNVANSYVELTNPADNFDLCIATLGNSESDVLGQLMSCRPPLADLIDGASVTIERIDDETFVPAERFVAQIDLRSAMDELVVQKALADAVKLAHASIARNDR